MDSVSIRKNRFALATFFALSFVALSFVIALTQRFLGSASVSKQTGGTLASACMPSEQNDKVYFVSCGGTF